MLTRRDLLAAAGSTFLLPTLTRAAQAGGEGFSFIVLGDMHYDRMEHHDLNWLKEKHAGDLRQIEGYCKTTELYTPRLLAELRDTIASSPRKPAFIIQVGDLLEGLCGRPDLAALQARDALNAIRSADLGVPFLITKGNHDVTGPGSVEAYGDLILPFIADQARSDIRSANFTLEINGKWFVFFDAYDKSSLQWLEQVTKNQPDRPMFFIVHPPVVPYNARSTWHLFASEKQAEPRRRLLEILGRHRAVALTGHLHKYAALGRRTDRGVFTQLAVCSVLRSEKDQPKDLAAGLDQYSGDLVRFEPSHSPETIDLRRRMLDDEKPAITTFDFADLPGYAIVHVTGDKVHADIHAGLGHRKWKTVDLTPM